MSISVRFAWYDLWIGAFIERNHPDYLTVVYVCPLPTLLIVFRGRPRLKLPPLRKRMAKESR